MTENESIKNKEIVQWLEGEISLKKREIDVYKNDNTAIAKIIVDSRQRDLKILENIKKDYENKEPKQEAVLTNEEREWLKNFLRPFRDKVHYVEKIPIYPYNINCDNDTRRLTIGLDSHSDPINLPIFLKDEKYKGMEDMKRYTLKELGIYYTEYYKEDAKIKVDGRNILTVDCSTTRKI